MGKSRFSPLRIHFLVISLYLCLGTLALIVTIVSTPGLIICQLLFIHFFNSRAIYDYLESQLWINCGILGCYYSMVDQRMCFGETYPRCSCRRIPPTMRNATLCSGASWVFSGSSTVSKVSMTFSGSAGLGLAPSQIRHLKGVLQCGAPQWC